MSESLFFKNSPLLNGQPSPYTGSWTPMARSRDFLLTSFGNASGSVIIQYKDPIFGQDGISIYNMNITASGYAEPVYGTTPISEVRAISSGNGNFWCNIIQQN